MLAQVLLATISGTILLWTTGVCFFSVRLGGDDRAKVAALGWPLALLASVPWREWLPRSRPGTHRLMS